MLGEEGGALERPELDADPRDLPVVHDGFGDAAVRDVGEELAAVKAVRMAGFSEELLGLSHVGAVHANSNSWGIMLPVSLE